MWADLGVVEESVVIATASRPLGPAPLPLHDLLPPGLLEGEEGGVHHVTHVHVREVTAEVFKRHPVRTVGGVVTSLSLHAPVMSRDTDILLLADHSIIVS